MKHLLSCSVLKKGSCKVFMRTKDRLLITGVSGRVGRRLFDWALSCGFDVWGLFFTHKMDIAQCVKSDICDGKELYRLFNHIRPTHVIHCAAISQEAEKSLLQRVNVQGSTNIAVLCEQFKAHLLYLSTDLVFDGQKGMYREEDPVNPQSFYGESKYLGEGVCLTYCENSAVVRITINYGKTVTSSSFGEWIVKNVKDNHPISLFSDQYRSPIFLGDMTALLLRLSQLRLKGLYHLGGKERISRYEFALAMTEVFSFAKELLVPEPMAQLKYTGSKCKDCSLDSTRITMVTGMEISSLQEGLERFCAELK